MRVREIDDLQETRDEWGRLLKDNLLGNNIFLTWIWMSTWWKHCGKDRRLVTLLVEDGDEVLAIAPLMSSTYRFPLFGKINKIEFLSSPDSDYANFIVLKNVRECLRLILDYLVNKDSTWDWIELMEVPETTATSRCLETLSSEPTLNLRLKKRVCSVCPYIHLPDQYEVLINSLSRNMRQNLNRSLRRISSKHRIELKKYDDAGYSVADGMRIFIELHEKRWNRTGLPGEFAGRNAFREFHMDVAERFADQGWLGLYFLMVDDEPASAQYNFEYEGRMYYYLGGFDPAYSEYSIGNLMLKLLLQRCVENRYSEYHMLRGDEFYKLRWTQSCLNNDEIRITRGKPVDSFYNFLTWSNAGKRLAQRFGLSLKKTSA